MNARNRKFLSYYKPYLGLLLADLTSAGIVSATTLLIPLCARYLTKNVLEANAPNALEQVYWVGAGMLALVVLHTVCNVFFAYQGHVMGALMESDMRQELFEHYQKLSFSFYDEHKTGELMTRLTNDSFDLAELYHHGPEEVVISLLNFVGASIILISINLELALITFLFLPVMAAHAVYFNRKMRTAMRASRDRIGDINAQVEDSLAGIRVAKSFTNEAAEVEKFAFENRRLVHSRREEIRSETLMYEVMLGLIQVMTVAVIVFGGVGIVNARLDLADLLAFLLYIGILIEPIKRFSNFTRLYQLGMSGFERFMEVLEIQPDIQDSATAQDVPQVTGHIEFRRVSFKYREDHDYVLENLSLQIRAGEYVALVGASGVGKTTLCSLIPRFYEIDEGEIRLDGRNLREIQLSVLRKHIGLVQQDVYLFAGTVAENIRYGKPTASRAEIIEAAKKAQAHNFVMALPTGYDTDIGQRGVKLSGGQKQRLSIARVFLKDPPIIIFDEATSALDNESERAIQNSLEDLANNRTMLIIAHRLSTVRNAQRIVVLTDKGIEEQGPHEALMALNGAYANLYNMQLRI